MRYTLFSDIEYTQQGGITPVEITFSNDAFFTPKTHIEISFINNRINHRMRAIY